MSNLDRVLTLIRDDNYAATFQSLGQYRAALLQAIPLQPAAALPEAVEVVPKWRYLALVEHSKQQDAIIADMRQKLATVSLYEQSEVWFWQGDGEDYPDSLVCPVVIQPDHLRQLIAMASVPSEQEKDHE